MPEDKASEEFTITISGDGVDIRRKIDKQHVVVIMSVLMGAAAPQDVAASGPVALAEPQVKIALREFLDQVHATRKPDQIVAIGHYIVVHEGKPTFTRDDVKSRFAAAKEPMPSNFPRDFAAAIKVGMIAEAHQKTGHFYVTKTGIQLVDRRFSADLKK